MAIFILKPAITLAHDASAIINLDPPSGKPGGVGTLTVNLIDPYGNPLPATQVRGMIDLMDRPASKLVPLTASSPGIYEGKFDLPDQTAAVIRIEVDFLDDQASAVLPIRLGQDWFQVKDLALELQQGPIGGIRKPPASPEQPNPEPPPAESPLVPIGIGAAALAVAVGVTLYLRRGKN
jgi:hypothetical protein